MKGDTDLKTLECLRGRLLAERQASRIAKVDSERMGNKLVELEKMLKQEIKMRNKAEKKLKLLKKKLESLNISFNLVESDQSSTSEKSEVSFMSSTTSGCASEANESEFNVINSVTSQDSTLNKHNHEIPCNNTITFSSSSSNSAEDFSDNQSPKSKEVCSKSVDDDDNNSLFSSTNLRSSEPKNETDHDDYVDNSLALVLVNLPESSAPKTKMETIEFKPVHENVAQVLDSLRYIREKIQSSMEMRHMVRVGPT